MQRPRATQKGDIMIRIGAFNTLTVKTVTKSGYLLDGGSREIFLPKSDVPNPLKTGDAVDVFIYNDQKESLKATTQRPHAQIDEFAVLTVKHVTGFGAFLDWGIQKDLFLPAKHQKREYKIGEYALVRLILDHEKTGVLGTTFCEEYISYDPSGLKEGDKVSMLIIGESKLGYNVIVDNAYRGIVFRSDALRILKRGTVVTGYVKHIREDGKLDCSLKPIGFVPAVHENQAIILKAIRRAGGVLYLHDKSSPEEIREQLGMSKKQFKAAIGTLYKQGKITILPDSIKLKQTPRM